MQAAAQQVDMFAPVPLTMGEVSAFRKREPVTPSQWSEKHRVVKDGPWQGPWSNEGTPYLVEPMDTWNLPYVRSITILATEQSGKSQVLYNCWGYALDHLQAQSLFVLTDEKTAGRVAEERLHKIIRSSPRLRGMMFPDPRKLGKDTIKLRGATTFMGWPRSEATVSTFPMQCAFLDELDKWPAWTAKSRESDPVSLAEGRTTAFKYNGKVIKASTPSVPTGYIWIHLNNCQDIRAYAVRCPECGELQIMRLEQLGRPEEVEDAGRIEAEGLAWYECEHCGDLWDEGKRRRAVAGGQYLTVRWDKDAEWWTPAKPVERPISVGFWFNAFVSPFVPLARIAAQALRAENDDQAKHVLYNKYLGLPWTPSPLAARDEDHILQLCDERRPGRPGIVPPEARFLFATGDNHDWGKVYEIRAWAMGQERESWLVAAGVVDSWAALERVMFNTAYLDHEGNPHAIDYGLMDARYRKDEVYDWCMAHPTFLPSMGIDRRMDALHKVVRVPSHDGLWRINFNANNYKDTLAAKLMVGPADPGAWHLHTNMHEAQGDFPAREGLLRDYAKQLCSEARNEDGTWTKIKRDNHFWDTAVLQLVAVNVSGVANMIEEPPPPPRQEQHEPQQRRRLW